jgi:hypothetical protein
MSSVIGSYHQIPIEWQQTPTRQFSASPLFTFFYVWQSSAHTVQSNTDSSGGGVILKNRRSLPLQFVVTGIKEFMLKIAYSLSKRI